MLVLDKITAQEYETSLPVATKKVLGINKKRFMDYVKYSIAGFLQRLF